MTNIVTIKKFRLPGVTDRLAVIGRTGSGKTQAGLFWLSKMPIDKLPFVIINYKQDRLINAISRARHVTFKDKLPKEPGLYILSPRPDQEDDVERYLWRMWERERIGLFSDETYLLPIKAQHGAVQAILTQGRSKRIPSIWLMQRPAFVPRFVFSEANFFAIFHLSHREDKKKIDDMISDRISRLQIPEYHSLWYDVDQAQLFPMAPVPTAEEIVSRIDARLTPRRIFA